MFSMGNTFFVDNEFKKGGRKEEEDWEIDNEGESGKEEDNSGSRRGEKTEYEEVKRNLDKVLLLVRIQYLLP